MKQTTQNLPATDTSIPNYPPTRIETATHVIHLEPRISAAKLAEYVVADPSRQETIVKNAKRAPKVITFPYSRVRNAFSDSLGSDGIRADFLDSVAATTVDAPFQSPWQRRDNENSAAALKKLSALVANVACENAQRIHRPENGWPHLDMSGVKVSVQPELVFSLEHRGVTKLGAVILATGQSDGLSLARTAGRFSVGDYLTVLVYRMLELRLSSFGKPLHTKCYAIDVFRDGIYTAPASFKTMLKHLEAACRMIALRWDTIPSDIGPQEEVDTSLLDSE